MDTRRFVLATLGFVLLCVVLVILGGASILVGVGAGLVIGEALQAVVVLRTTLTDAEGLRWSDLTRGERFHVWRAVTAGEAVTEPQFAPIAVAYARRLGSDRQSLPWTRAFLPDPWQFVPLVAFSVELFVIFPHWDTLAIAVAAVVYFRRIGIQERTRMALRAETANLQLLDATRSWS